MDSLAYLVPSLGCAAMMGAMVWMMSRGGGSAKKTADRTQDSSKQEIDALRAEIEALRSPPTVPVADRDA